MASTFIRLLDPNSISANQVQPREQVVDLGAYRQLCIDMRLLKPGTGTGGGRVKLQHASVNEEGAFRDLTNATWVVDSSGQGSFVVVDAFLRYVRWVADGAVAGGPVPVIDIVAKS